MHKVATKKIITVIIILQLKATIRAYIQIYNPA